MLRDLMTAKMRIFMAILEDARSVFGALQIFSLTLCGSLRMTVVIRKIAAARFAHQMTSSALIFSLNC